MSGRRLISEKLVCGFRTKFIKYSRQTDITFQATVARNSTVFGLGNQLSSHILIRIVKKTIFKQHKPTKGERLIPLLNPGHFICSQHILTVKAFSLI